MQWRVGSTGDYRARWRVALSKNMVGAMIRRQYVYKLRR